MLKLFHRLCCIFGFHDFYTAKKEERWNFEIEPWAVGSIILGVVSFVIVADYAKPSTEGPPLWLAIACIVASTITLLAWAFVLRYRYRIDGRCLRCGLQKIEISSRKNAENEAERFFKNYNKIDS